MSVQHGLLHASGTRNRVADAYRENAKAIHALSETDVEQVFYREALDGLDAIQALLSLINLALGEIIRALTSTGN